MFDGPQVRCKPIQTSRWFKPVPTLLLGITQRASLFLLHTVCCILGTCQELKIVKCVTFCTLWKKDYLVKWFPDILQDAEHQSCVQSHHVHTDQSPIFTLILPWRLMWRILQLSSKWKGGGGCVTIHPAQSYLLWGFFGIHLTSDNLWEQFYQTHLILWLNCNLFSVPVS